MDVQIDWAQEAWNNILEKVTRTSKRIGDRFPHASVGGEYQMETAFWWTAGFWPGLHGTSHFPDGKNVDVPLIYGDYFFAEGISRLLGNRELFW